MQTLENIEIKIVLLGAINVGKTSIVQRYIHNTFVEYMDSTVGASFNTKILNISGNMLRFQIWDTAGAERYRALTPMYYRSANVAIIVYDVTRPESLEEASNWHKELVNNGVTNCEMYLVGNKTDIASDQRDDGDIQAELLGCHLFRTSAKEDIGINELFDDIAARCLKYSRENIKDTPPHLMVLSDIEEPERDKSCCSK